MIQKKQEQLETRKRQHIRENIEEYLADAFCTIQMGLELIEKHIDQKQDCLTQQLDKELLRDVNQRLRVLEETTNSLAGMVQSRTEELYAFMRPVALGSRLQVFCEQTNWEMQDLGFAGRVRYTCECPDDCVQGDPVFAEAVLTNLILSFLWSGDDSHDLQAKLCRSGEGIELCLIMENVDVQRVQPSGQDGELFDPDSSMRLTRAYCEAMNWELTIQLEGGQCEARLFMPRVSLQAGQLQSRHAAAMDEIMQKRLHRKLLLLFEDDALDGMESEN